MLECFDIAMSLIASIFCLFLSLKWKGKSEGESKTTTVKENSLILFLTLPYIYHCSLIFFFFPLFIK